MPESSDAPTPEGQASQNGLAETTPKPGGASIDSLKQAFEGMMASVRGDADAVATLRDRVKEEHQLVGAARAEALVDRQFIGGTRTDAQEDRKAIAATRSEAQEDRRSIAATRSGIEGKLNDVTGRAEQFERDAERLRALVSEISGLHTGANDNSGKAHDTLTKAAALLEATQKTSGPATEAAARIEALKTQVEQTAQVAEKRSGHIENGRLHADEVRAKIDLVFTQAQQSATNAEGQSQAARSSAESLNNLYQAAQTTKANTDSIAESVGATRAVVEGHAIATEKLAKTADAIDSRVAAYESDLNTLIEQSKAQGKQIKELLAGATDAGLASAFDKRSKKFQAPEYVWHGVFIASLLGLITLAVWHAVAYQNMQQVPDWQQVLRMFAIKVPLAAPLIWLAIHSARQAALAKRMEEEYAFKATISMSFDGYRRQMAEVGRDLAVDSPLAVLCKNTLREIAAPPGRVYEDQRMDPNLATSIADGLKPTVEAVVRAVADKVPDVKV